MARFDRKKFFDGFDEHIDASSQQEQVDGLEFLLGRFEADNRWKDIRHIAYALATVYRETAFSFQPVEEGYYLGSAAKVKRFQKTLRYYPFFGRGYVQLTWLKNYKKAGDVLGIDLVKHPELALDPANAFEILTAGLFGGWFGGKLTTYINSKKTDYVNARQCVNVLDKAGAIAAHARTFEKILRDSVAEPADTDPPINENVISNGQQTATAPQPMPTIEVEKESPSLFVKIGAAVTAIGGFGLNVGSLVQSKLEELTAYQIGFLIAALGVAALGIWWYRSAAKGANARTLQLVDKAADPLMNTIVLKDKGK